MRKKCDGGGRRKSGRGREGKGRSGGSEEE